MAITVDPDGLSADGAALGDHRQAMVCPGCVPPGADSVSVAVEGHLSALAASLAAMVEHAGLLRSDAGVVTQHTAAAFRETDHGNASLISGAATTPPPSAAMAASAPPAPALPGFPAVPAPQVLSGEAQSIALYGGPGSGSLREFAVFWRERASALTELAAETRQTAASIDSNWRDGRQRAGANTMSHAEWLAEIAQATTILAAAADTSADNFDRALDATPSPAEFADARREYTEAWNANVASGGLLTGRVSAAAAQMAGKQTEATEAGQAYLAASAHVTDPSLSPPRPAPPIAPGGVEEAAEDPVRAAVDPEELAQAAQVAGTIVGAGVGAVTQLAQGVMGPVGGMSSAPMSALSTLSGLPGMGASGGLPSPDSEFGSDRGFGGDQGADATSPAGGGAAGGGGDLGGGGGPMPPSGNPVPAGAVGPAAGVAVPPTAAGMAGRASGMGPMGMYPPMMGRGGANDDSQRNTGLFPDRRVVLRPVPNTEAVFGELEPERRPRTKRAAQEEDSGAGQG